jgi:hypothetical protein
MESFPQAPQYPRPALRTAAEKLESLIDPSLYLESLFRGEETA